VIVAYQGQDVQGPHDLTRRVAATPPTTRVRLTVARPDGRRELQAALDELRDQPPGERR
jgi:S1-C subfamily serine protease